MPDYEVRVLETVTQEKVYTVEASSEDEARELAEAGETIEEEFSRQIEVTGRAILGVLVRIPDEEPGVD